jgi:hypothetical protein
MSLSVESHEPFTLDDLRELWRLYGPNEDENGMITKTTHDWHFTKLVFSLAKVQFGVDLRAPAP